MIPWDELRMVKESEHMRFSVLDIGDWSKTEVFVNERLYHRVAFAECNVHLNCALTMPNVMRFLFGDVVHVGEEGGKIVVCHVLESELPKLLVLVRIILCMIAGVFITSTVSKPDIVPLISEHESRRFIFIIYKPSV
jgi:hypothetical protein